MARNTLNSQNASADAKRLVRENKKSVLVNLCRCIHRRVQNNNGRMPHGYMKTILDENKSSFEWLTRDIVNSAYTRFKKRLKDHSEQQPVKEIHLADQQIFTSVSDLSESAHQNSTVGSSCRQRGGRPSGSTNNNTRKRTESIIAMKNDITREYIEFKKSKKSNTPKEVLEEIIKKHQKKRNRSQLSIIIIVVAISLPLLRWMTP